MNYRHVYMLIIEHAKSEEKLGIRKKDNGNYYENHHILPRSLFPLWAKRTSNKVLLSAREHFFCHQLLTKIYPCKEMFYAITAFAMHKDYRTLTSRQYALIRETASSVNKDREYHFKKSKDEIFRIRHNAAKKYFDSLSDTERQKRFEKAAESAKKAIRSEESRQRASERMRQLNKEYTFEQRSAASKKGYMNMSPETKERHRELARQMMIQRNLTESKEDKLKRIEASREVCCKKVKCLNDGKIFSSILEAAAYYNINRHTVSKSIHNKSNGKLKFILLC